MHLRPLLCTVLLSLLTAAHAADTGFKPIFNGIDLSGWEGMDGVWSVRDGAITGQTTASKVLEGNTFLVWKGGQPANFELRAKFKLTGQNPANQANSGIQYRSKVLDPKMFVVGGYQADIDMGKYIGMLYDERGRGILMQPGEKIRVSPLPESGQKGKQKAAIEKIATVTTQADILAAYKKNEWNEIRIVAKGNHLQHWINGKLTADVTDTDAEKGAKSGVIALQLHKGPPMTAQYKDLQLKVLP